MASGPARRGREDEEDKERGQEEEEEEEAPSHLPLAPPSELLDLSTTVDPSYVVSLIRQLLPHDFRAEKDSPKIDSHNSSNQGSKMCCGEQSMIMDGNSRIATAVAGSLDDLDSNKNSTDSCQQNFEHHFIGRQNSPVTVDDGVNGEVDKKSSSGVSDDGRTKTSEIKDPWEDAGCILWDLAANRTHAEFMVNNFLLEVLLATLNVSRSSRVTEICLGIIGNLACHESVSDVIASKNGLIETIVGQLFLDDSTCLSEAFRLLSVSLQGITSATWAEALLPEQLLLRILWIVGNTLNSTLLEKSIEFLVAVVNNQQVASILLQQLMNLGLPNVLLSLLTCELSKLRDETKVERSTVVDLILHLVEAISATDSYSKVISSNEELFHLVCGVVKLPDKVEIAGSCASAVVIIANILADEQHLSSGLSQDFPFVQGLLDILPFVSDDAQARDALWCIVEGLLVQIQENDINMMTLDNFVSLILDKSYVIEDDLDLDDHSTKNEEVLNSSTEHPNSYAKTSSLSRIAYILNTWISRKSSEKDVAGIDDVDSKVHSFLDYCRKHGH